MLLPTSRPLMAPALLALLLVSATASADFTDFGASLLGVNFNSRGASLADIDNDHDLDLLFTGSWGATKLFRNDLNTGSLGFTQVANWENIAVGNSWSSAWGDINGDGFVDAFIGQTNFSSYSEPYRTGDVVVNNGSGGFVNESTARNLQDPGFHQNVAWADMNGDNRLDLVIAMEGPEPHQIYLQDAQGEFTPVGAEAGFQNFPAEKAYGMAIGDTDGDGDLDVYISTCRSDNDIRNFFYENQLAQTGELSFIDIADTNGTQNFRNTYGSEFLDFDDDGDLDLFVVGADRQASKIYRNDGGNQFTDTDIITGTPLLSDTSGDLNGGRAVDYDNDGDLDLFFHDHKAAGGKNNARKLYRNNGDWSFTDVTFSEGIAESNRGSYDSPWGDLDRDGDQDLIATTDGGTLERVYLSDESTNGNNWLYVELNGDSGNTSGLGASLYATINEGTPEERTIRREANTNAGTFNQSDLPVHFGLGDATLVDQLKIVWPNGVVNVYENVAVDQYVEFTIVDIAGDFNGDGAVDNADLNLLLGSWGSSSVPDEWVNGLVGTVDNGELNALLGSWGIGAGASVPEPASLAVLMTGFTALSRRRR